MWTDGRQKRVKGVPFLALSLPTDTVTRIFKKERRGGLVKTLSRDWDF
jgi:hypothetical protein